MKVSSCCSDLQVKPEPPSRLRESAAVRKSGVLSLGCYFRAGLLRFARVWSSCCERQWGLCHPQAVGMVGPSVPESTAVSSRLSVSGIPKRFSVGQNWRLEGDDAVRRSGVGDLE